MTHGASRLLRPDATMERFQRLMFHATGRIKVATYAIAAAEAAA